jgi:hypothetical protein
MASDTLEKVNRVAARGNSFSFDDKINEVKEMLERKNDLTVPPPAPLHNELLPPATRLLYAIPKAPRRGRLRKPCPSPRLPA